MNIFQVLSQGKARLHEPSISAFLGYLLDSNKDHGLGDTFIRAFIKLQGNSKLNHLLEANFINSQVELEAAYSLNGHRKDIDIQIIILNKEKKETFRIIIENKIRKNAANANQLKDYYEAILEDEKEIKNLHFVFLTPVGYSPVLDEQFQNLQLNNNFEHTKKWIFWNDSSDGNQEGVLSIIKNIIKLESQGEITPINEYMRQTLKAFINHSSFSMEKQDGYIRKSGNIGDITDEYILKINDEEFLITRRDSTQIQVYNIKTDEKVIARHILQKYIDENKINIDYTKINTRTIGKKLFEFWKNKSQAST